jgi:glycine hydroxymethyltransferase
MHIIAAKAVCFEEASLPQFKEYVRAVVLNAQALANRLHEHDFDLVTGGTDNHLLLVRTTNKGMTGKELEELLEGVGITVNKNAVPFDQESPFITSGIRIGTPALTTRGMGTAEMEKIADIIDAAVRYRQDETRLAGLKGQVHELCRSFPLYSDL